MPGEHLTGLENPYDTLLGRLSSDLQRLRKDHELAPDLVIVTGDLAEMLELPAKGGLLITQVDRGSPAEEAGLHGPTDVVIVGGAYQLAVGGDLILAVENQPVTTRDALQRVMDRKRGGEPLSVTIYRKGRTMDIKVKLGELPAVL